MAQLIVRNLEDEVVQKLKVRAARRGHSAEAEHREILREALGGPRQSFKEMLMAIPPVGDRFSIHSPPLESFRKARNAGSPEDIR